MMKNNLLILTLCFMTCACFACPPTIRIGDDQGKTTWSINGRPVSRSELQSCLVQLGNYPESSNMLIIVQAQSNAPVSALVGTVSDIQAAKLHNIFVVLSSPGTNNGIAGRYELTLDLSKQPALKDANSPIQMKFSADETNAPIEYLKSPAK